LAGCALGPFRESANLTEQNKTGWLRFTANYVSHRALAVLFRKRSLFSFTSFFVVLSTNATMTHPIEEQKTDTTMNNRNNKSNGSNFCDLWVIKRLGKNELYYP
jgi:hypothetical protein